MIRSHWLMSYIEYSLIYEHHQYFKITRYTWLCVLCICFLFLFVRLQTMPYTTHALWKIYTFAPYAQYSRFVCKCAHTALTRMLAHVLPAWPRVWPAGTCIRCCASVGSSVEATCTNNENINTHTHPWIRKKHSRPTKRETRDFIKFGMEWPACASVCATRSDSIRTRCRRQSTHTHWRTRWGVTRFWNWYCIWCTFPEAV